MSTPAERLARRKAAASPDRSDPVSVCKAYMGRLGLDDWAGAAALVDKGSLQDLKKSLIQLIAAEPDSVSILRDMFPRLKTRGDVEKAKSEALFADFLTKVFTSSEELRDAMARADFEILGRADQGPDLAYVVYRYRYTLEGAAHGKVAVACLRCADGAWSMLADEDIQGLLAAVSLRARMNRSFSLPDKDRPESEEESPSGSDSAATGPKRFDLVSLLRSLGAGTLDMDDLESEILPLMLSPDMDVVLGGLKLLKPLVSAASIPRILELSSSPDHRIRWHVLDCLAEGLDLAPDECYTLLLDTLAKDPEPWVRKKAASLLAHYVHPGVLEDLKRFLLDDDLGLVTLLLDAAAATEGSPKLLFLEEVILHHPEVKIRDYARQLLRDLSRPDDAAGHAGP